MYMMYTKGIQSVQASLEHVVLPVLHPEEVDHATVNLQSQ